MNTTEPGFTIAPARYAKRMALVRCESDGSGWKTRAMRLCEHLNGRWTHREGGYVMSARKAERLRVLFAEGRDASAVTGRLDP